MITSNNFLLNIMITIKNILIHLSNCFFVMKSLVFGLSCTTHLCLHSMTFSSVSVCDFHFLRILDLGSPWSIVWLSIWSTSAQTLFPGLRPHSGVNRIWIWVHNWTHGAAGIQMEGNMPAVTGGIFRQNSDAGSSV